MQCGAARRSMAGDGAAVAARIGRDVAAGRDDLRLSWLSSIELVVVSRLGTSSVIIPSMSSEVFACGLVRGQNKRPCA